MATATVSLVGSDGCSVNIAREAAVKCCGFLADALEHVDDDDEQPLSFTVPIEHSTLEFVKRHCEKPLHMHELAAKTRGDHAALFALVHAANFLQATELLEKAGRAVATSLLAKRSPQQLRSDFGITADLSPEEEAAALAEPLFVAEPAPSSSSSAAPTAPSRGLSQLLENEDAIDACLLWCDDQTLRTLKGVSAAWRGRARRTLCSEAWQRTFGEYYALHYSRGAFFAEPPDYHLLQWFKHGSEVLLYRGEEDDVWDRGRVLECHVDGRIWSGNRHDAELLTPEQLQNVTFDIECFTGGDAEVQQDVRHPHVVAVVTDGVGALLREAAAAGAHALVDALVSGGISPFLADESASTALHAAAANGHAKVCRRLVRAGTDGHVNNLEQISAFDLAFQGGHDQVRRVFDPSPSDIDVETEEVAANVTLRLAARGDVSELERRLQAELERGAPTPADGFGPNGVTPLMMAARNHQPDVVRWLLALTGRGRDALFTYVDVRSLRGCTALSMAAEEGDAECVGLLLRARASVDMADDVGATPLLRACFNGHEEAVDVLVTARANLEAREGKGWTPLIRAAQTGNTSTARTLLRAGAAVDAAKYDGTTPLMMASNNGHLGAAELLLEHNANADATDSEDTTALMIAAQSGHEPVAAALIGVGVGLNHVDGDGFSALMLSCQNDHADMVQLLATHGADIDASADDGTTALMYACRFGHLAAARAMLAAGAALDGVDQDGNTALLIAVAEAHGELAISLIDAGADGSVTNNAEESVRELAEERGLDDVLAALDAQHVKVCEEAGALADAITNSPYAKSLSEQLAAGLRLDGTGYEGEVEAAAAAPLEAAVPLEAAEEL